MDVGSWCNAGHRHRGYARSFSETGEPDEFMPYYSPVITGSNSKTPIWRLMWRRIKKEKNKLLKRSYSTRVQISTYDIYAYGQNFDESSTWNDDVDYLSSRSFSARFAVPSRIFQKNQGLTD